MPGNRRLRDAMGRLLPINEDGSVIRLGRSGSSQRTQTTMAYGYSWWQNALYYLFKIFMMLVCAAGGCGLAYLMAIYRTALFGESGYGLLQMIVELIESFFPWAALLFSAGSGIFFVAVWVEIDEWYRAFWALLVVPGAFLIAFVLLFVLHLAFSTWWSFLLLCLAVFVLNAMFGDE